MQKISLGTFIGNQRNVKRFIFIDNKNQLRKQKQIYFLICVNVIVSSRDYLTNYCIVSLVAFLYKRKLNSEYFIAKSMRFKNN